MSGVHLPRGPRFGALLFFPERRERLGLPRPGLRADAHRGHRVPLADLLGGGLATVDAGDRVEVTGDVGVLGVQRALHVRGVVPANHWNAGGVRKLPFAALDLPGLLLPSEAEGPREVHEIPVAAIAPLL